jgi:hypothetical protein
MALQGFEAPPFKLRGKENTLTCSLNKGTIGLSVFRNGAKGADARVLTIRFDQNNAAYLQLCDVVEFVRKAPLGARKSLGRREYDMNAKRFNDLWNITIEKDQEMCYKIILTDVKTGASATFPFKAPSGITSGDENNKAEGSALGLRSFMSWMRSAYDLRFFSYEKFVPGQNGGGRPGGYGGAPRPSYSAPVGSTQATAAPAAAVAADPDDLPF